jgi:O-antigen biosynthesis protein
MNNDLITNILNPKGVEVHFKPGVTIPADSQKIAVLATNEFEGFSKNGGIGSYYATLSQHLAANGWCVILLLCQNEETLGKDVHPPSVHHVFSTQKIDQILDLQPIHQTILTQFHQATVERWFDEESFRCAFFMQALCHHCPDAVVYVEFPEIWGFGYRTIQMKRSGVLNESCLVGVTSHGGFEWLRETNQQYLPAQTRWLWQAYHYEQFSYEQANITFFPSHFLKEKYASYGWKTDQARHQPYFVPILPPPSEPGVEAQLAKVIAHKIPIVFFGRLEERKGLCTFVEAIQSLDSDLRDRLHVIFLGKFVWLQSPGLKHLESQEYIAQSWGDRVSYTLLSDQSSQQALQLIQQLEHPIVCLTSLQENFPNTALEVGQIPVRLVVSDTGGLRETLQLVNRDDGVYWFEPGHAHSLAQGLKQAIEALPSPAVARPAELQHINQYLLQQRLESMNQAFLQCAPKATPDSSVLVCVAWLTPDQALSDCLESLTYQTHKNLEVVVLYPAQWDADFLPLLAAQQRFPTCRFVSIDHSLGQACNQFIDSADYFLQFSADSLALPWMVENFVNVANQANAMVVMCPQTQTKHGEIALTNLMDSSLLKLLELNYHFDSCALFSRSLLQQFRYLEQLNIDALNWQIIAAAIATGKPTAYYPYPLFLSGENAIALAPAQLPKERYHIRQYLSQIAPAQWLPRQLHLMLTGIEQLLQSEGQHMHRIWSLEQETANYQTQLDIWTTRSQAWMKTAQQTQDELDKIQSKSGDRALVSYPD